MPNYFAKLAINLTLSVLSWRDVHPIFLCLMLSVASRKCLCIIFRKVMLSSRAASACCQETLKAVDRVLCVVPVLDQKVCLFVALFL